MAQADPPRVPWPARESETESVRVESILLHLRLPRLGQGVEQLVGGVEPLRGSVGQLPDSGWRNECDDRDSKLKTRKLRS